MYDLSDLKLFEPITNEDISNGNVTINGLNGKRCLFIIDNEDGTSIKREVTTVNDFNGFLDNDYKLDHIECGDDGIYIYLFKNGINEKIELGELSLYLKDNVSCILEDNVTDTSSNVVDSNNIDINEDTDKAKAESEDDIDIIDEDFDLKPVIATDMSEVIGFNNANKEEALVEEEPDFIENHKEDLAASLEFTIVDILMKKLKLAVKQTKIKHVAVAGGVSANNGLRNAFHECAERYGWTIYIPRFSYTTDNAAMIGITGYYKYLDNDLCTVDKPAFSKVTFQ